MNLDNNIGVNKYKHIYVFGCSHSLNTNSIDTACKSYSEIIADNLEIPYSNVYNYSINGSSNFENLYYLNCLNLELNFSHYMNDKHYNNYGEYLPTKLYDNSLIIFQLTYWYRNVLQHSINKYHNEYELIPLSPYRKYEDDDITKFNEIYYKKLSNISFLQRNSVIPIHYSLKGIKTERTNISTLLISWDSELEDIFEKYIPNELSNLQQKSIDNKWTCHSEMFNGDLHLSPNGNKQLAEYLLQFI